KYRMFGLSHADGNQSYNTIQFGLYLVGNGTLQVWESGSPRVGGAAVGTYAPGDKLRVSVDSGVVTYRKNETTVLYTSTLTPTYPLFADAALYTNGATLSNAVIFGSGGCGNQAPIANAGGPYSGAPGVQIQFTGSGSSDPDGMIASYAWTFGDGATATIAMPTHIYTSAGTYPVTLTVTDNLGLQSSPATTTATVGCSSSQAVPVIWANTAGVNVNGNSLTKNVGDQWGNSGAFSTQSFTGNGYVEVTASETNTYRMFGLSHADVNQSYNTIQFGLYLANNGRLEVWESGSPRGGVGTYAPGD